MGLCATQQVLIFLNLLFGATAKSLLELQTISAVPCNNPISGETGVCMFNLFCHVANGIHIAPCMDRDFIGSCCKLSKGFNTTSKMSQAFPTMPVRWLYKQKKTKTENKTFSLSSHDQILFSSSNDLQMKKPSRLIRNIWSIPVSNASFQNHKDISLDVNNPIKHITHELELNSALPRYNYLPVESDNVQDFVQFARANKDQIRSVVSEASHNFRQSVTTDASHDQRKPVVLEESHDMLKPVVLEESHDMLKPVALNLFHDHRKPVSLESSHDMRIPMLMFNKTILNPNSVDNTIYMNKENQYSNPNTHVLNQNIEKPSVIWPSQPPLSLLLTEKLYMFKTTSPADLQTSTTTTYSAASDLALKPTPNVPSKVWSPSYEIFTESVDKAATESEENASKETSINETACGISRNYQTGRIIGGYESRYLEWPWMVSLHRLEDNTYEYKCGAVLLNNFWAITVAHCVHGRMPNEIVLRLGEYNLIETDELYHHLEKRVYLIIEHPDFDILTFENDLALLRFYQRTSFQENIAPVCLPKFHIDLQGKTAVVIGWGRLSEGGEFPEVLREVHVPILANDECERMFAKAGLKEYIPGVFLCAGLSTGGKDACEGDSGGPMMIKGESGQWFLVGLISWGRQCAVPNQPGVYTRITEYIEWIRNIISV